MTIIVFVPEQEKEKAMPFGVNLMRSQALHRTAQLLCHIPAPPCMTIHDKCLLCQKMVCSAIATGTNMQFRNANVWAGHKRLSAAEHGRLSGTLT